MNATEHNFYRSYFWKRRNLYNNLSGTEFFEQIQKAYEVIIKSLKSGGKLLIFGNGGSAAEAQHFAAELVCQFEKQRKSLPAIALTTDSSILTAQSNDNHFTSIFSRQIEALGKPKDTIMGLTTSDISTGSLHSRNIQEGFIAARRKKMKTIGLISQKTKNLLSVIDCPIIIPHENTAIIQEAHLSIIHLLCKKIEENL
jgi:D-sedoheptulose 7-phosphate isomerase